MESTIWTYPWDMVESGPDQVARELSSAGLDGVSLAATYHCFDQLRPHGRLGRLLTSERSAAYYPARDDAYGKLRPARSNLLSGNAWTECADVARDHDLTVTAWTLFLHNTHLATTHPECAQMTCTGDRLRHQLCPSNPDVREYACSLAQDLSAVDPVSVIECESLSFGAYGHTHFHPKIGVELGTGGWFLFSLCFCDDCIASAEDHGIDITELRSRCLAEVEAVFDSGEPLESSPADLLSADSDLQAFVNLRDSTVTTLIEDVASASRKPIRLLVMGERLTSGVDVPAIARSVEAVEYLCYSPDTDRTLETLSSAFQQVGDACRVAAGLQAYPPASTSGEQLAASVQAARETGSDLISFYNYGIMPRRNLEWIRRSLEC